MRRWLIPYRVELVKVQRASAVCNFYTGYRRVYLFGVLVAEIQETKPW